MCGRTISSCGTDGRSGIQEVQFDRGGEGESNQQMQMMFNTDQGYAPLHSEFGQTKQFRNPNSQFHHTNLQE